MLPFERVRLTNAKRPGAPVLSPFVFLDTTGTHSRASSRRALKAEMRAGTNDEIMRAWYRQTGD